MNSKALGSFVSGPLDVKTQVPQIKEAAELWALHRFVMRKHNPQGRKIVYDMKDAEPYLRRVWREGFVEQAQFGMFAERGTRFLPTWKGAYRMTWGLMYPMKWVREAQLKSRAKEIIGERRGHAPSNEGAWDENRVWVKAEASQTA